jgi:CubicO group peptidase (beta-lactamase class C family)
MTPLPRSTPEEVGIPSEAIGRILDGAAAKGLELHSLMILRHGRVAGEGWWTPYRADRLHLLYSLSKSFTSTAVGFAVAEGRLGLDDPVLKFFPNDAPRDPSPHLRALKVRHLLTMSVGHALDDRSDMLAEPSGNWPRAFLARPIRYAPGKRFLYSSSATYMLSAILHRLTGERLVDYLRPRLFDPIGIERAEWVTDPKGIDVGGWGLSLTTEDIARFGQFYLEKGRRLLPAKWVETATQKQIDTRINLNRDWKQGYGFQFWRCQHGAYRADGAFGQVCLVHPEQDLVVAITACVEDMQPMLDLLWTHLLPSLSSHPLPARPWRMPGLSLRGPSGAGTSPMAAQVSGRTYVDGDRSVRLDCGAETSLTLVNEVGMSVVRVGIGEWREGTVSLDGTGDPIAAWGAWAAPDIFVVRLQYLESPASTTLTFRFGADGVTMTLARRGNLYLPAEAPVFRGTSSLR